MSKDSENENERFAREWMALPHWGGWRVGMISDYGWLCMQDGEPPASGQDFIPTGYPDLDHPGTRAFLLEDVRRAWASEGVFYLEYIAEGRRRHLGCLDSEDGPANLVGDITETGTLIAALRAAPEKTK